MATIHEIPAVSRTDEGKGASRRLRRAGKLPAIVYGAHQDPQSILFEHNDVYLASQNEWFYSSILDLKLDGKNQKVLLRDMQRHPFKQQILHLDLQRVSENEALRVRVPLHFLNQEKSAAGKTSGVIVMGTSRRCATLAARRRRSTPPRRCRWCWSRSDGAAPACATGSWPTWRRPSAS